MRTLSIISDSPTPCGVETFARELAAGLNHRDGPAAHGTFTLTGQPGEQALLGRQLFDYDALLVNFPVVAWKKRLLAPLLAMARARRHGLDVVLVLHEWADLDWKRRLAYRPALRLATRILFSSPYVAAQFAADRATRHSSGNRGLVPIPPNLPRPAKLPTSPLTQRLDALAADGTLLIGQFGAIYPKKQSTAVLDVAAALRERGRNVHTVFIGDFIAGGSGDPRRDFDLRVDALGLRGHVTVTGYIDAPADVFAAIERCHALVYRLPEGLTSRRSSILAGLQTSTPVLVNAPAYDGEFDHHPTFRKALSEGALTLVPHAAGPATFAEAVLALPERRSRRSPIDRAAAWSDVLDVVVPTTIDQDQASRVATVAHQTAA